MRKLLLLLPLLALLSCEQETYCYKKAYIGVQYSNGNIYGMEYEYFPYECDNGKPRPDVLKKEKGIKENIIFYHWVN